MTSRRRPRHIFTGISIAAALPLMACFGADDVDREVAEVAAPALEESADESVAVTPEVPPVVSEEGGSESPEPAAPDDEPYVQRLADLEQKERELDAAEKAASEAAVLQERERELRQREAAVRAREVALAEEQLRLREQRAALEAPPEPPPPALPTAPVETVADVVDAEPAESQSSGASRPAPAGHDSWGDQAWRRGSREPETDRTPSAAPRLEADTRPRTASLAAGTVLTLEVESELSSRTSRIGEEFSTRVTEDVRDREGRVVVPAGSELLGFVTDARPLRRVGGRATLGLEFDRLVLPNGEEVEVRATLLQQGKNKKRDKVKIAGATIAGAILGQILGGDTEATAAGAAVGAAASTAAVMRVKGQDIEIPAGSELEIELTEVVTWTSRYLGVVER